MRNTSISPRPRGGRTLGVLTVAATAALLACAGHARAQSDNFDDGDDAGWTRYEPLAGFGAGPAYTFPSGGYRINAPPSPSPGEVGPARGGSLRTDVAYGPFYLSVDLVDWDHSHDQALGLLARTTGNGLGALNGYALTRGGASLDITRITGEVPTPLGMVSGLTWNPARDYRLVFAGEGATLTGAAYDLADLSTPVATLTVNDAAYESGYGGLVVFDNSNWPTVPAGPADATFDNYVSAPSAALAPEPGGVGMIGLAAGVAMCRARRR